MGRRRSPQRGHARVSAPLLQVDTLVVTFGEVAEGARRGVTKRPYWMREDNPWKIIFEGAV